VKVEKGKYFAKQRRVGFTKIGFYNRWHLLCLTNPAQHLLVDIALLLLLLPLLLLLLILLLLLTKDTTSVQSSLY
jgi:hypothetical protein